MGEDECERTHVHQKDARWGGPWGEHGDLWQSLSQLFFSKSRHWPALAIPYTPLWGWGLCGMAQG
eukprot:CAMPEP_0183317766 /NCGR_PEP_ID=MMETSP0160_2-20130417/58845_1 /TAXON_ID=2839 ORGANISM="Odontella Sinensis, Strain Grunow 1884" /NCGR_SAMPLE_ID=MMETSP0160_2 /ASSEMBLY_ACC=CAM_ASM_000250 /LENGTH=64 /DNA_ID=CAMNT_0025483867 /DNA_START=112 /DNA_END=302 /DNA_ORIENTATION=-